MAGLSTTQDILHDTDSEGQETGQILCETDSDMEHQSSNLLVESDTEGVLKETDSEGDTALPPPEKKRKYSNRVSSSPLTFLEKPVCRHAHLRLYGVGSSALQRLRAGEAAFSMHQNRLPEPKHSTLGVSLARRIDKQKWPNVLAFFWLLYMSVAEILPTRLTMPKSSNGLLESYVEKDPDFEERYIRSFMSTLERNFEHNPVTWKSTGIGITLTVTCLSLIGVTFVEGRQTW